MYLVLLLRPSDAAAERTAAWFSSREQCLAYAREIADELTECSCSLLQPALKPNDNPPER
jgi:hypothetical protein